MALLKRTATISFVASYLLFQVIYPTVPWFLGGDRAFTWRMFAGYDDEPRFVVVQEDGTEIALDNALRRGDRLRVRVLGPEVDQGRFVPPWLCANWKGIRSVVVRDRTNPLASVISCDAIAR
jgi:hypothetical protein